MLVTLSAFVFLFLVLFQPFNLDSAPLAELVTTSLASALCFLAVGWGLNSLRATGKWPFKDSPLAAELFYIASFIFIVGFLVYLLRLSSDYVNLSLQSALQFQLFAFMLATILVFISRLLTALLKLQRQGQTRSELLKSIESSSHGILISLQLNDSEGAFSFPLNKWIGAKSAGNYLELYFATPNHKPNVLVRSTLKLLTAAMQDHSQFYHCHRSYAINLDYVEKLNGRAQGYKLKMKGVVDPIPVSRNAEKGLLAKLSC